MSDIPISPQFELRHSNSAMVDIPEPRFMSIEHFCKTYGAAICEFEIVMIDGQQFVDLDSNTAQVLMHVKSLPSATPFRVQYRPSGRYESGRMSARQSG